MKAKVALANRRTFLHCFILIFWGTLFILVFKPAAIPHKILKFKEENYTREWILYSAAKECLMIDTTLDIKETFKLYAGPLSILTSKGYIFDSNINDKNVFLIGPIDDLETMAVIGEDDKGFAIYLNDHENSNIFKKMDRLIIKN